jgi:hypothetical protein
MKQFFLSQMICIFFPLANVYLELKFNIHFVSILKIITCNPAKKKIMKQFFNISKIFLHTVIKGLEFYLPIKVQHLTNP